MISVSTRAEIHADLFGIPLKRIEIAWDGIWHDGRLLDFRGTTTRNGETDSVRGWSQGERFIVEGARGRTIAPADIQPINPWSSQFVRATIFMSPETGKLSTALIEDNGMKLLNLDGRPRQVHHYTLKAEGLHHLYFDDQGKLVETVFAGITGSVTLALKEHAVSQLTDAQ